LREIAKPENLEQTVEKRDYEAKTILEIIRLAKTLDNCQPELAEKIRYPEFIGDRDIEDIRKKLDASYWYDFFNKNQIEKYVTQADKEKMLEDMEKNPVAFNSVNAMDMLKGFIGSKEATATNMIKKVYKNISDAYFCNSSNRGQSEKRLQKGLSKSIRLSIFYIRHGELPSYVSDSNSNFHLISDLERALYLCDGKLQPDYQHSVTAIATEVLRKDEKIVDAPYFRFQIYKNGNIKLEFKSKEVLARFNKWGREENTIE